jgi:hypothetical protein
MSKPRLCACGCERPLTGRTKRAKFYEPSCRYRSWAGTPSLENSPTELNLDKNAETAVEGAQHTETPSVTPPTAVGKVPATARFYCPYDQTQLAGRRDGLLHCSRGHGPFVAA